MFNFLHTFNPAPILISFGSINIYWYGFFIVLSVIAALVVAIKLAPYYKINKDIIIDLAFYLIIFGIIGARIYDVFLEIEYYSTNPINAIKIWQGGLAIHGALITGILTLWYFSKKEKLNFWLLASIITTGLALAQAIGRWGNYFNQELFGYPTILPWGIPIDILHRPTEFYNSDFFHPAFLYESIGNLIIFVVLVSIHYWIIKNKKQIDNFYSLFSVICYLIMYSFLRFFIEFIRIDRTPEILGLRWPQIISLLIIIGSVMLFTKRYQKKSIKKAILPAPSETNDSNIKPLK